MKDKSNEYVFGTRSDLTLAEAAKEYRELAEHEAENGIGHGWAMGYQNQINQRKHQLEQQLVIFALAMTEKKSKTQGETNNGK